MAGTTGPFLLLPDLLPLLLASRPPCSCLALACSRLALPRLRCPARLRWAAALLCAAVGRRRSACAGPRRSALGRRRRLGRRRASLRLGRRCSLPPLPLGCRAACPAGPLRSPGPPPLLLQLPGPPLPRCLCCAALLLLRCLPAAARCLLRCSLPLLLLFARCQLALLSARR